MEGLLGQMCLPDRVLPEDVSMLNEEGVWRCFFLFKTDLKCSGSLAICNLNEGFALNIKFPQNL